jgi:hypothetical protein
LTLGCPGASGGLAIEGKQPANQDVLIGAEALDGSVHALPFFADQSGDPSSIDIRSVARDYRLATDDWSADDLALRILSPAHGVPEPGRASDRQMRDGLLPGILATVTLDNRAGTKSRRAFFGIRLPSSVTPSVPPGSAATITAADTGAPGFIYDDGAGRTIGVACSDPGASAAAASSFQGALRGASGGQGTVGLLRFDVPAGRRVSFRIAIGFWHPGTVAQGTGIAASNWYTKVFSDLGAVISYALGNYDRLALAWEAENRLLDDAPLSSDQRFQVVHGVRSYLGNTYLLAVGDRPLWMVLEGNYAGLNTSDLTVDLMLFELRNNPWTVRNVLEWYLDRYSYTDNTNSVIAEVTLPTVGGETLHNPQAQPGGISFTHDMGGWPNFNAQGTSSYEKPGLTATFSYMTAEELTNWTLTALCYIAQTQDDSWASAHLATLEGCFTSLLNRDNPDPANRDGIMSMESTKTGPNGREITTYDSLDASLGQARHSAYLTSKQWAAYVCLAKLFDRHGKPALADQARQQARLAADATVAAAKPLGHIPALLPADGEPANPAQVIPAIEGLAFPLYGGAPEALRFDGEYGEYMQAMRAHLEAVLKPGACLYDSGAWKLSSTSNISWLSTPYLHQHIARRILGITWGAAGERCDAAFASWCTDSTAATGVTTSSRGADYWCFVEQFQDGHALASYYYPRGSLSALWLEEHPSTAVLVPTPTTAAAPSRRHRVTIRLKAPKGQRITTAEAFVNGGHVKTIRGHSLHQITIDLPARSRRRTALRILARTNRGRTIRITRVYTTATRTA